MAHAELLHADALTREHNTDDESSSRTRVEKVIELVMSARDTLARCSAPHELVLMALYACTRILFR